MDFFSSNLGAKVCGEKIKILGYKNAENELYTFTLNPRGNKIHINGKNHYRRLTIIC